MVLIIKIFVSEDVVRYKYQPEKEGQFGIVEYYPKSGNGKVIIEAEKDINLSYGYIVLGKISRYTENKYPDERVICMF